MKRIMIMGLVGVLCGALAPAGWAAPEKIAVVRLEELVKAHPDTAPAEAVLEKQRDDFESERKDMMAERDKRKKAFEAARDEVDNPALSEDGKAEKIKAAQEKFVAVRDYERDLQDLQMQRQKELNDHGRRLRDRILEKVRDVVKRYAEDKGYALVLNADQAGMVVLYSTDKVDVTADVKTLIDKEAKP